MIYYDLGPGVEACSSNIGDVYDAASIITPAHQAHSTAVAQIPEEIDATYGVDALITDRKGLRIGIRTADCVPVLLYDSRRQAIAAIHSGWNGTVNDIIARAIASMQARYGCDPHDFKAVIGPCIHVGAFEVGDEVYEAFCSNGYGAFAKRMSMPGNPLSQEKWHIDLPGVCREQLLRMGVGNVQVSPFCTYECHDQFYSYRYCKCADRSHRIVSSIMLNA